jgi:hypothetical protein
MGEPIVRNGTISLLEYIEYGRQTQGTETSKYLEEEKANAISQVAASETETAQTKRLASWGCRTFYIELQKNEVDEAVWKDPPQKVTAL